MKSNLSIKSVKGFVCFINITQVSTKFWADDLKRGCYLKQLGFLFVLATIWGWIYPLYLKKASGIHQQDNNHDNIEREAATPIPYVHPTNAWVYLMAVHSMLLHSEDQCAGKSAFIAKYHIQEAFVELSAIKGMYWTQSKRPTIFNREGNKPTGVVWGTLTVSSAVSGTYFAYIERSDDFNRQIDADRNQV